VFADDEQQQSHELSFQNEQTQIQVFSTYKQRETSLRNLFHVDSAANRHFCNNVNKFETFDSDFVKKSIIFDDSSDMTIAKETVKIAIDKSDETISTLVLRDVLYVPRFHTNLVSTSRLEDRGYYWDSESKCIWKREPKTKKKIFLAQGQRKNGMYAIESLSKRAPDYSAAAFSTRGRVTGSSELRKKILRGSRDSRRQYYSRASLDTWHSRMGHIRKEALLQLPQAVEGVQLTSTDFERPSELCEACSLGHMAMRISRKSVSLSSYAFHTVHFDIIFFQENESKCKQ
jgi:hypothetical protein